jgi:aspartate/methionine/tyrosine aminotransferase
VFNDALFNYLQTPEVMSYIIKVSRERVQKSIEMLRFMPKVKHVIHPEACYYVFLKIDYQGGSWKLFNYLLQKGVNVVPGVLFGVDERESWIRVGCGHDDDTLDEGLGRLSQALEAL